MGKKNLEKLFQEKLKDFSEVPEDSVWNAIEASLNKKEKSRKVIPIWWKLGGVAAVLLIAITLINPFEDKTVNDSSVTEVNDTLKKSSEKSNVNETFENLNSNRDQIVDAKKENVSNSNTSSVNQEFDIDSNSKTFQNLPQAKQHNTANDIQVAASDTPTAGKMTEQYKNRTSTSDFGKINQEAQLVEKAAGKLETVQNSSPKNPDVKNKGLLNQMPNSSKDGIAENAKEEVIEKIDESKKKSILDVIAEQNQEEVNIAENTGSKWSAGPSIAPVYFDAIGEGSPVHSIFVPNSKSGGLNLSYGLSVAYEVSKKLSIRSGIHKVDYGYSTNDVEFSSSIRSSANRQLDNIDYASSSRGLIVGSKLNGGAENFSQDSFSGFASNDAFATSAARSGTLEQQFGYIEVPIELNYALVDRRFGINIMGGISSLILVDNSISLNSGELTTEVGEANNINSLNFSTNVGFGMNYKFNSKIQVNIEPIFKYQLNTFSEIEGTFNPFSIGVYSGLSLKF